MNPADAIPASFAERALFEPIAAWLGRFATPGVPSHAELDALLAAIAPDARSGGGARIRFVPPAGDAEGYEARIFASGEVPTRAGDWHDFFNALAWCAWPRTKAACNHLHLAELHARTAAGLPGRGPRRDALTQFDECGIVEVSSDADIPALLAAHLTANIDTLTPRSLSPLPLLGIPGVTADSECAAYYRDTRQFRPRRQATPSASLT